MLSKLKSDDIPGALTAITGSRREDFQEMFTSMQPDLAVMVDQLGTLEGDEMNMETAEYNLIRTKDDGLYAYPVYFMRAEDGIWRIDAM